MDLTAIPLHDLEDLQKAVGEEISRRITAQNAPREIDRIIRREPWIMIIYDVGTAAFFDGQVVGAAMNLDGLSYIIPDIGNI